MPVRTPEACCSNAYIRNLTPVAALQAIDGHTIPDIDMDAYADQALAFMYPTLNKGLSLVNFALELKDLKSMNPIPSVKRILGGHRALKNLSDKRARGRFVKELITRMNGAALNASFGIVPFIKDVVDIFDELVTLIYRLAKLKEYAGKVITRHYKRTIFSSPGVYPNHDWIGPIFPAYTYYGWPANIRFDGYNGTGQRPNLIKSYRSRWVVLPVYHATWRYIYTLDGVSELEEKLYAHLDSLGVRLDPSIVWNAIPFSFVVDWVVDVSGFLQSFARNNFPIRVVDGGFVHSYKYAFEASTVVWMYDQFVGVNPGTYHGPLTQDPVYFSTGIFAPYGPVQVYNGTREFYNRVKASPSTTTIEARIPRLRQAALAGSLLLSKVKRLNSSRYQRWRSQKR
jgi:hypothetical protein